jgi:CBS domain-containing protein
MLCSEVMKLDPICLEISEPALLAARRMRDENIGFIPVCDSSGRIVGTVTDRDITVRLVANDLGAATPLAEVMTNEVVACRADDVLEDAERSMEQAHKSRIMCLDGDGRLVGVISLSDIARREDASHTLREIASREAYA